jgi:hypothetical protein
VSVTNASYDAAIAPSASVTIGFNGSGSGSAASSGSVGAASRMAARVQAAA